MAFIYVKTGGTATGTAGKYTTAKTGSWSTAFTDTSQYYGSFKDAYTNAAIATTDTIFVSNLHNTLVTLTTTSYQLFDYSLKTLLISVDDSDISIKSVGAKERYENSQSTSLTLQVYNLFMYGVTFEVLEPTSNISLSGESAGYAVRDSCSFILNNVNIISGKVGLYYGPQIFKNCNFYFNSYTYMSGSNNSSNHWEFFNCNFYKPESTSGYLAYLDPTNWANGPFFFTGCDFSQANVPLFNTTEHIGYLSSLFEFNAIQCVEASNNRLGAIKGGTICPNGFFNSTISRGLNTFYYALGVIEETTLYSRVDGALNFLNQNFSLKVLSSSSITKASYLTFKVLDVYYDTSSPTTFTVEFAQIEGSDALTESDMSVEVYYKKSSSFECLLSSTTEVLPSATLLPTSSKTWNGLTNPVKQYLSVTTTETGSYGLCSVYVNIFVPSRTIYICPKIDIT